MTVRARRREHLQAAIAAWPSFAGLEITENPDSDYQFRVVASKDAVMEAVALAAGEVEYTNFKGACLDEVRAGRLDAPYERALHHVWATMSAIQPRPPYARSQSLPDDDFVLGNLGVADPWDPPTTPKRRRKR